jgi:hypothetical protein
MEESETDKLLKSVIETLIRKEAPKFKSLIQKELASRIHSKIEELKKALSGQIVTGVKEDPQPLPENLPGAPSAPPVTTPMKAGDLKIVPTAAGSAKDDMSLDPNFEKEFYHSSQKYKGQDIIIKQLGTGFGKPVRVYINGRRWEFFPGPKAAMKATKEYLDGMVKDVKKDPQLAANMTAQINKDKNAGVAQVAAPVDAGKPNEVADADLKKKELEGGKPPVDPKKKKPSFGGK